MAPRTDLILFLDTETTGVEVPQDEIIEIGLSLVSTEAGYPEVDSFTSIIIPKDSAWERMMKNDVVRKMHQSNGLLDELTKPDNYVFSLSDVERDVIAWLDTHLNGDTTHIPYGGSGVLHFDRRFIDYFMPRFSKRLSHWAFDVGVMRRMFIKAGAPYASIDAKTHRALDDARVHAEEFRWYQKFIRGDGQ